LVDPLAPLLLGQPVARDVADAQHPLRRVAGARRRHRVLVGTHEGVLEADERRAGEHRGGGHERLIIASRASWSTRSFPGSPAWPRTFTNRRSENSRSSAWIRATSSRFSLTFHPSLSTPIA